jgi:hypothetical protein
MAMADETNPAAPLDLAPGQVVLEIGYDEDVDHHLRAGIESVTGRDMIGKDYAGSGYEAAADVVLLWYRDHSGDFGDLTGTLIGASGLIGAGGVIWLITPRAGLDGWTEPGDIRKAVQTARLSMTKAVFAGQGWESCRLTAPQE